MEGFDLGDVNIILVVKEPGRTCSNGLKLDKFRLNKDIGKNWFTNRVVDEWNRLGSHVVGVNTIDTFKKFMDSGVRITRAALYRPTGPLQTLRSYVLIHSCLFVYYYPLSSCL